ncbi:hypothetical protein ACJX0J_007130, partial [Zea mays]
MHLFVTQKSFLSLNFEKISIDICTMHYTITLHVIRFFLKHAFTTSMPIKLWGIDLRVSHVLAMCRFLILGAANLEQIFVATLQTHEHSSQAQPNETIQQQHNAGHGSIENKVNIETPCTGGGSASIKGRRKNCGKMKNAMPILSYIEAYYIVYLKNNTTERSYQKNKDYN